MGKLILILMSVFSTSTMITYAENGQWTGLNYPNLASYSYGPPSKAQTLTREKEITLTLLTDDIKLMCTTRQTNMPIVWRKQPCENDRWTRDQQLEPTTLAEGTYNYFPDLYDLEVEGSANEMTSTLVIRNVSMLSRQGVFTCQKSKQQQESFLIGNQDSLKTCQSRSFNQDIRETKTNAGYTVRNIDSKVSQQWYDIDTNTISKTQWDTGLNYNRGNGIHHKGKHNPSASNRYAKYQHSSPRSPSKALSTFDSKYPDFQGSTDIADSYFPIWDPDTSGPYPNSVNFKPSVAYPDEEYGTPVDGSQTNFTQESMNETSTIATPSNMTGEFENGMFENTLMNNTSVLFNATNVTEIITDGTNINMNGTNINIDTVQIIGGNVSISNNSSTATLPESINSTTIPLSPLESAVNQTDSRLEPLGKRVKIRVVTGQASPRN